jgi:urocanate hydratase
MEANNPVSNISDLYGALMQTIGGLKDGSISVEQAKAINEAAQVMVNAGKLECEYLKIAERTNSKFLADKNVAIEETLEEIEERKKLPYQFERPDKSITKE